MGSGSKQEDKLSHIRQLANSPWVLGMAIFLLALGPRILDLTVFVGPDEFFWVTSSANFAQALVKGELGETYQAGHPGVTLLWMETVGAWVRYGVGLAGGGGDWEAIIGPEKTMATLGNERQVVAVMNTALLVGSILLIRRLFGSSVAWVAGFLLAFDPFLLTEARAVRTEGLFTGFNTVALFSLLLYLERPTLRYNILAGMLTGLALLSKISAVSLLPLGISIVGGAPLFNASAGQRRWWASVQALLIWGGTLLLTVVLLWPALWVGPAEVAQQMFDYVTLRAVEGGGGGHSFFLGQPRHTEDLGLSFYLVVLLYRTGPLVWAGIILLIISVWLGGWPSHWRKTALGVISSYLAIYLALISRSELKFDRYTIPMLPTLNLLAAMGMVVAWQMIIGRRPHLGQLGWLAASLILVSQLALAWPHHPYYYTFWNPLLGGPKQAVKVLPVGSGSEGIDQAAVYLNALPNAETISLASGNSQKIAPLFKGQTIPMTNLDGQWFLADYTFIYISQLQRGRHDPEIIDYLQRRPPVFVFDLLGLDYGWIYQGPGAEYFGGDTKLEGRATLHAYSLSATELRAGGDLIVTVYFRNEGQRPTDRFYARLVDPDGYLWSEAAVSPRPGFEAEFRTRKAVVEGEVVISLPEGMPKGTYFLKLGYDDLKTGQLIGQFELPSGGDLIEVTIPDSFTTTLNPSHWVNFNLDEALTLVGYDLDREHIISGESTWLTLYWQAIADVNQDYVLGIQLLDQSDTEVTYWLGRPARSTLPTNEWRQNQVVQDPWLLAMPSNLYSGRYKLVVSVYNAPTGELVNTTPLQDVWLISDTD